MGLIARVISFVGRRVKTDTGGKRLVQAEHFGPCGDDSPPLKDDYGFLVESSRSGTYAAVAYADTTAKTANPGEVRRYARSSSGAIVSEVHQRNDGSILLSNNGGSIELLTDGSINLNGVIITTSGILTATSVTGGGVTLHTHTHAGATIPPPDAGS